MATIAQIVAQIRTAIYGKDVRENIAQGIEKCYNDVTAAETLADAAATRANTAALRGETINSELGDNADDLVIVSQTQPSLSKEFNKVWVKPDGREYQVPTWEEFEDVKSALNAGHILESVDFSTGITTGKKITMSNTVIDDANHSYTKQYSVTAGTVISLNIGGSNNLAGIAKVDGSGFIGLLLANDATTPNKHYEYTMTEDATIVICFRSQTGYVNNGYIAYRETDERTFLSTPTPINFNTSASKLIIPAGSYVQYSNTRIGFDSELEIAYNVGSDMQALVLRSGSLTCIQYNYINVLTDLVIFIFSRTYIRNRNTNSMTYLYKVDNEIIPFDAPTNQASIDFLTGATIGKAVSYLTGLEQEDANMSMTAPFFVGKGFTIILDVGGAAWVSTISKKVGGKYYPLVQSFGGTTPNLHYEYTMTEDAEIVVSFRHQTGYVNSGYVVLDMDKYIGVQTSVQNQYEVDEIKLSANSGRMTINKNTVIRGNGYNIDLSEKLTCTVTDGIGYCTKDVSTIKAVWSLHGDLYNHVKLTQKTTKAEVLETNNTFAYINGQFIIHADYYDNIRLVSINDTCMTVTGNVTVEIYDLHLLFGTVCLEIAGGAVVKAYNCEFAYATVDSGERNTASSFYGYACKAHHNTNDGFNAHNSGSATELIDCEGFYNFDDGTSQHDAGCYVKINGGVFHHNGGGGIASPVVGAIGSISNVVCHNNYRGIELAVTDADTGFHGSNKEAYISNATVYGNTYGIWNQGYDAIVCNSYLDENTTDLWEGTTATTTFVGGTHP